MEESLKSALRAYWLGLGLLGVAVGYFVALSQSPVIAVLLPLLFGLLGTGGIILIGKLNLEQTTSKDRLARIGVSLSVFCGMIVLSSAIALVIKNFAQDQRVTQLSLTSETASRSMELLALRKKLEILGATPEEQERILMSAKVVSKTERADPKTVQQYLKQVVSLANPALVQIDSVVGKGAVDKTKEGWQRIYRLRLLLHATTQLFDKWDNVISGGGRTPYSAIANQADMLQRRLSDVIGDATSMEILSETPQLYVALVSISNAVLNERPILLAAERSEMPDGSMRSDTLVERLLLSDKAQLAEPRSQFFARQQGLPLGLPPS